MPYNLDRLYVSHSSISTLRGCERKFEFRKLYHRSRRDRAMDAEVGTCLHVGYQKWLETGGNREAGLAAMMFAYPIDLQRDENKPKSLEACYATLNAMFDSYNMGEFQIATIHCLDGIERPAIEVPFMIELKGFELLPGVKVYYIGFIDMIGYNQMKNRQEVVDIKTHRDNTTDLTPKWKWDEQCMPYQLVVEATMGQPIDELTVNYMSCFIDIEKPVISKYSFHKDRSDLQDWARGLLLDLQNLQSRMEMSWFRRNSNSCISYRKKCDFFDVCEERNPEKIEAWMLSGMPAYVEKEFQPWLKVELELRA